MQVSRRQGKDPGTPPPPPPQPHPQWPYLLQTTLAVLRVRPGGRLLGVGALGVRFRLRRCCGAGLRHLPAGGRHVLGLREGGVRRKQAWAVKHCRRAQGYLMNQAIASLSFI